MVVEEEEEEGPFDTDHLQEPRNTVCSAEAQIARHRGGRPRHILWAITH